MDKSIFIIGNEDSELGSSKQVLVPVTNISKTATRRWWTLFSLVLLVAALSLVNLVVVLLNNDSGHCFFCTSDDSDRATDQAIDNSNDRLAEDSFTLDDYLSGRYSAKGYNGSWLSDNEILFLNSNMDMAIFDVSTLQSSVFLSGSIFEGLSPFRREISPDRNFVLFAHDFRQIYRHSYYARYTIFDVSQQVFTPLANGEELLQAFWGPTGNALVYIFDNDIFYHSSVSEAAFQVTNTGQNKVIFNGHPDWVYEEEVISDNKAMWFSPDGLKLAFATFNDSMVAEMQFEWFGEHGKLDDQYPVPEVFRYPKAGATNPTMSLQVADLSQPASITVQQILPVAELQGQEYYLYTAVWRDESTLVVNWMNRYQDVGIISVCPGTGGECVESHRDLAVGGWSRLSTSPVFSSDGNSYLVVLPINQGFAAGNYQHLTLKNTQTGELQPLTEGMYMVRAIDAWDENRGHVYFIVAPEDRAASRHLYRTDDEPSSPLSSPTCITCDLSVENGIDCSYASVSFSPDNNYYILSCNGPDVPATYIVSAGENHTMIYTWEENLELQESLTAKQWPDQLETEVPIEGGYQAIVRLLLPPGYDPSGATKYPMMLSVYGAPEYQEVLDNWGVGWGHYLTTNMSIVYVSIDARGSDGRGDNLIFESYHLAGIVEVADQIAVTKALLQTYPFLDATRVSSWGWSYGGYTTARILQTDSDGIFKCGMSVAPISSWRYYDTAYTERYMGLPTPEDNLANYNLSDCANGVENFRNKKFFLAHGVADDNVHFQGSMMISQALEDSDILFEQHSYPDQNHNIHRFRQHLYHTLSDFLFRCFDLV